MARALAAAIAASLLAVSGAGGAGAQTPKRGGTVVIGGIREPACLNVFVPACSGGIYPPLFFVLSNVLAHAFDLAPEGYRPYLVSRVTRGEDRLTLTYHIRPEARWSDGTPVTAWDLAFFYRTWRRSGLLPDELQFWRAVRAVGPKTFQATLRAPPNASWRTDFAHIMPRHALAGESSGSFWLEAIDNPKTGEPIGSGPFLVRRWERGKQLTLVRNPRYWGPHTAYLDRILFRFVPGDPVEALRRGEVDVVEVPSARVAELRGVSGIRVLASPGLAWEHLELRVGAGGRPALKSKLVRRALAYGIDRVRIVRALFGELVKAPRPLDSLVFLTHERPYRPNWGEYRYRPTEARRLLERAGCRRGGDGVYVCAGQRLSLRFVTTAGNPQRERTLELVQRQLRAVGVEVVPVYAPSSTVFGTILPSGEWDVALFAWRKLWPEDFARAYRCGHDQNFTGYCSRLSTRDHAQLDFLVDAERMAEVGNRADRRLARDVPAIPLFQTPYVIAVRRTVQGVVPNPYLFPWRPEDWWLER